MRWPGMEMAQDERTGWAKGGRFSFRRLCVSEGPFTLTSLVVMTRWEEWRSLPFCCIPATFIWGSSRHECCTHCFSLPLSLSSSFLSLIHLSHYFCLVSPLLLSSVSLLSFSVPLYFMPPFLPCVSLASIPLSFFLHFLFVQLDMIVQSSARVVSRQRPQTFTKNVSKCFLI